MRRTKHGGLLLSQRYDMLEQVDTIRRSHIGILTVCWTILFLRWLAGTAGNKGS